MEPGESLREGEEGADVEGLLTDRRRERDVVVRLQQRHHFGVRTRQ